MTGLSGILYGGLVWDLMTIDNLIEFWADWSARRDDGGLGYGGSRFNRLMAGETLMPAADAASQLPYGVDGDAAASLIDRLLCAMPEQMRRVVWAEYRSVGLQADKAAYLGKSLDCYRKTLMRARFRMASHPEVVWLLKKMS